MTSALQCRSNHTAVQQSPVVRLHLPRLGVTYSPLRYSKSSAKDSNIWVVMLTLLHMGYQSCRFDCIDIGYKASIGAGHLGKAYMKSNPSPCNRHANTVNVAVRVVVSRLNWVVTRTTIMISHCHPHVMTDRYLLPSLMVSTLNLPEGVQCYLGLPFLRSIQPPSTPLSWINVALQAPRTNSTLDSLYS